ncbi:MAG: hypothetical protein ACVCEJ_03235 [Candidatus Izemoplasmataceae bacterium]
MEETIWRFPGNNYTDETGLDTAEMETFKKDPMSSLARELCQNSIDARENFEEPVKIEFKLFEIEKQRIPNIQRLEEEVLSCQNYWKKNKKISKQLKEMKNSLDNEKITCLRVSDFNTSGLLGVKSSEQTPWYLLTKGSGISNKVAGKGGSKGIGKYATFVTSNFNTVFYATKTKEYEEGFQGICKLCSTTIVDTDEKTQGIGYYGSDKKNNPIFNYESLDPSFSRSDNQFGTDVLIIGFRDEYNWISEIVTKILDSFLVAIMYGDLVVEIEGIIISKENVGNIVYNNDLIIANQRNNIISQYLLLTDESVYRTSVNVANMYDVELFIKGFSKTEDNFSTNKFAIIRYPYMKIKEFRAGSSVPCSAMCIIGNDKLNETLREYENPQHTDWYTSNIQDKSVQREIKSIIKSLRDSIMDEIAAYLSTGDTQQTDIEGAGEFLPATGDTSVINETMQGYATVRTVKPIKNNPIHDKGILENDDATGLQPDFGGVEEEGEDAEFPTGQNENSGGEAGETNNPGGSTGGSSTIMKREKLSNIKYRFIMLNRDESVYKLVFTSPYQEDDCELQLSYVDDSGHKSKVNLIQVIENNTNIELTEKGLIPISLEKGKKYDFTIQTNMREIFSSEVTIYAIR